MNILLIEDDPRVRSFLERGLRAEGYRVRTAENGVDGLAFARDLEKECRELQSRAVVLLDLMLPLMNGIEVCQTMRASRIALPILMVTAMGSTTDRVAGLRMGADDYLVKPFAFEELLARIEALGRRAPDLRPEGGRVLAVADVTLDRATLRVERAGHEITLTARELALLELLMSAPGRVLSRERILSNVWGLEEDPLTNVVDVFIRRLRAKLDAHGAPLIQTVRGVGYRLAG
jgi:DNA-binding response OmpR family regulator